MHVSVLLPQVLTALIPADGRHINRIIDGTLGAAGHSSALLERAPSAHLLGFDADPLAIRIAGEKLAPYRERVILINANYAEMPDRAVTLGWAGDVDAILLDLGVSSMQFDTPERGFSFRFDAPLDMRFNPTSADATAADLINTMDEGELANIFYEYGEEHDSRRIARAIVKARGESPLRTTGDLTQVIEKATPRRAHDKIHPATKVFQALRIAVNAELDVLEKTLPAGLELLKTGGRMAVISFHSLEDRIVKEAFRLASIDCICPPEFPVCVCGHRASVKLITKKPLIADEDEIAANPRSRSAKLRVVEKL